MTRTRLVSLAALAAAAAVCADAVSEAHGSPPPETTSGRSTITTPPPDTAGPRDVIAHPLFQLLDSDGRSVLTSGGPVSPMRTCGGGCHDTEYIAEFNYHAWLGADEDAYAGASRRRR